MSSPEKYHLKITIIIIIIIIITSGGDQFCLRYGLHVVCKMEDICQQGCNEFCKTSLLVE